MAFEFRLPDLAEGMAEAEVVAWKVKVGERVKLDQPLVEVMSDKATVEIPSPRAGTLSQINFAEGQVCPVGGVLFVIEEDGAAQASSPRPAAAPTTRAASPSQAAVAAEMPTASGPAGATRVRVPGAAAGGAVAARPVVVDASSGRTRVLATPATRKLARAMGVELGVVPASGKRGRVTSDDVRRFSAEGSSGEAPGADAAAAPGGAGGALVRARGAVVPVSVPTTGLEERIPFRGMRKRIADNMTRSKFTATHFTYVEDVDCTELVAWRDKMKDKAAPRGIKLTYLPFIIKAVVAGLKKWPQLNASLDEATQEIVRKRYYHMGIAAQGPQGLVVTVLRDADRRSLFEVASEIQRLADAVQSGSATTAELTGSTFTISSLGKLGGVLATPIINFPEVGVIGVHKMEQRAVVRDGQIVARWMLNLSISLDHRLVDGWDGAMFLQEVKALLEDPTLLFMEMA